MKEQFNPKSRDGARDHFLLSVESLTDLTQIVAEQAIFRSQYKILPHGSRLFTVNPGWEMDYLLAANPDAVRDTLRGLEGALRDPEIKTIFMSRAALMSDDDIMHVCARNGVPKNLVREGMEP